jgi:hypothetical protein
MQGICLGEVGVHIAGRELQKYSLELSLIDGNYMQIFMVGG